MRQRADAGVSPRRSRRLSVPPFCTPLAVFLAVLMYSVKPTARRHEAGALTQHSR